MNRATLRGLACGLVAACGVACSGPPPVERASRRPPQETPERAVSPPPTGRPEQRLAPMEERAGPQRALILGPQEVSVTQHTAIEGGGRAHGWRPALGCAGERRGVVARAGEAKAMSAASS